MKEWDKVHVLIWHLDGAGVIGIHTAKKPIQKLEDLKGVTIKAGGVPVIAHPGIMRKDEYIKELAGYGLKGIEVYHTDHNASTVHQYEELAGELGLLMTGGSDCHGAGKGKVLIGTVRVPYDLVEKLKKTAKR